MIEWHKPHIITNSNLKSYSACSKEYEQQTVIVSKKHVMINGLERWRFKSWKVSEHLAEKFSMRDKISEFI